MVGRERQRRLLQDAFSSVRDDRSCHLFTLLGAAGVGKSRLTYEFLTGVDATVVRGRCLSYGEGITYWPVVEVLVQLGTRPEDESAAAAIRSVLGETDEATTPDQVAWAFRKTLEDAVGKGPLVCVFDDIHWGEAVFLDLIEHVADWSRDSPIFLLCIARPELLDLRPGGAGGKLNATTVLLEPLTAEETDELIGRVAPVDPELGARIREAAEGNPLFVEEMLAMVRESGDGDVVVPPTIQALLAARLDQLDSHERTVLERGAVEGKIFHRGAVEALAPDEQEVPTRLMALVRKELVRPDRTQLPGDDAFRFRHLLIRDAAYDALPKAVRAGLHERFALWLEEHGADLIELDEILGYHLEQACRYREELGEERDETLAAAARGHLTAAGRRAMLRGDGHAALKLFERAARLVPEGEVDLALEFDRIDALFRSGLVAEASRHSLSLAERAARADDRVGELCGQIWEGIICLYLEPEGAADSLAALTDDAIPIFEAAGSDLALYLAYHGVGQVAHMRAKMDTELVAVEQAVVHAGRLGLPHLETIILPPRGASRFFGTTPIPDLLLWQEDLEAQGLRHSSLRLHKADALAMLGRFDEARSILGDLRVELEERGAGVPLALTLAHSGAGIESLAGNYEAAVELAQEGCRLFEEMGEKSWLSTALGFLAQALYELDRLEDAEQRAEQAAELAASDDAITQMLGRQDKAQVLARRGEVEEAERLAREAIAIGEETDLLSPQGDALADLAEVLSIAGRPEEAARSFEEALERYERKGNLALAARTRERLESLLLELDK